MGFTCGLTTAGGRAAFAVAAVAGGTAARATAGRAHAIGPSANRGGRRAVERRYRLALLVELGGLDLLLGAARQVHLHPDTLLLPPDKKRGR